jgi:hypothetical protein
VDPKGSLAILRFHLAVGTRLALRVLLPAVAAASGGLMLLGPEFLDSLARTLFGSPLAPPSILLVPIACLGIAGMAAPRICRGIAGGWLAHLPATGVAHRRAAIVAVAVVQAPVVLALALLSAAAAESLTASLADWAGLTLTALAAAALAVPTTRPWAVRPLALAALLLPLWDGWLTLASAALFALTDRLAGPLAKLAAVRPPGAGSRALPLPLRIVARAMRWRFLGAYGVALLPLVVTFAFLVNNELPSGHRQLAVRLGGTVAVVLLLAQLAEALAVLRPAWPWARSLPWSAQRRVSTDAALLAGLALAVLVGAAFLPWASPLSLLAVAALLPLLSLRAAGAIRRAPESSSGASGEILGEGLLAAGLVALVPWLSLLALAAVPFVWRLAAERERRQKVSRWLPLHHLAAGDPQSWSAS